MANILTSESVEICRLFQMNCCIPKVNQRLRAFRQPLWQKLSSQKVVFSGWASNEPNLLTCDYIVKMYKYLLFLVLTILAMGAVPQLSKGNFTQYIEKNPVVFVKFFAPFCKHCVAMAAQYELLYTQSLEKDYRIVEVNCTAQEDLCKSQDVKGYPTLSLYAFDEVFSFRKKRTAAAISSFIEELINSKIESLSQDQVSSKIGEQTFILLGGTTESENRKYQIGQKDSYIDIKLYAQSSESKFVKLYKKGSQETQTFTLEEGKSIEENFAKWVFKHARASVFEFSDYLAYFISENSAIEQYAIFIDLDDDFSKSGKPIFLEWCEANHERVICFLVSRKNEDFNSAKAYTQASSTESSLNILKSDLSVGYRFSGQEVSVQTLNQFYQDALDQKIEPTVDKMRESRMKFNYKNVAKLTSSNFSKTITENDFVFVEFYSPSCGHCVNFVQDYDKIAGQVKSEGINAIVAAVDITQSKEVATSEKIESFPTFKIFIKGTSIKYSKERTVKSIVDYIKLVSSAKLLVTPRSNINDIPKPFVSISGLSSSSPLQTLPAFYQTYPVYQVTGEASFSIEFHDQEIHRKFTNEKASLDTVLEWLSRVTEPTLVSIGESKAGTKLQRAIDKQIPILVVVNKHERSVAGPALEFLNRYCQQQTTFICGFLHKDEEDYVELMKWLGDKQPESNRLIWIDIKAFKRYLYIGDPNEATKDSVDQFIQQVLASKLPAFTGTQTESQPSKEVKDPEQVLEEL